MCQYGFREAYRPSFTVFEGDGITPLIPIIALTDHAFPNDRDLFLACGINDYVSKPIDFDELLELVEKICGRVENSISLRNMPC